MRRESHMTVMERQIKTVWITGASSGIGEACSYEFAKKGYRLVLTARSADRLLEVAEKCRHSGAGSVSVLPYDFSEPDGIAGLCHSAMEIYGRIDVLFLNAGISQRSTVEDTSMEMVRKIMEIDYFAPVAVAQAVLPEMAAAGGGKIAVTSSVAGLLGFPLRCAYSSAKHALYGFFETLQAEYHDSGIRVTMVCPGRVRTNISLNALVKGGERHGVMDPGQANGIPAGKAARKIVRAVEKGRREVFVGGKELLMVPIKRFFPGFCAFIGRKTRAM